MESVAVYSQISSSQTAPGMVQAKDLPGGLFMDFVEWIDRSPATTRTYITNLRQFLAWMRYTECARPQRQDILSYRDWLTAEHDAIRLDPQTPEGWNYRTDRTGNRQSVMCSANTAAQYLRSVRQFFRWTAANGLYPDIAANVHAPKIRHDTHRKDALTAGDVLAIEQSIAATAKAGREAAAAAEKDTAGRIQRSTEQGKRLFAIYLLAVNAGLRTIEISRANCKDLVSRGGKAYLMVWGKGHSEPDTRKPIAPEVYAAIKEYLRIRSTPAAPNSPLFVATGNRSAGQRIASTTISKQLKAAMRAAGYDSDTLTAHSLRHSAGTAAMTVTGNNLFEAQAYMRHANPATTEIYLHCEQEQQQGDIAQRIFDYYHGKEAPAGDRQKLESLLDTLNAQQITQLASIAEALAH